MNCVSVMVFLICLVRIQTENIYLNPGDEYKYSIFTGDTLTLQCPVNSSLKDQVRWLYTEGTHESILSIGEKLNEKHKDDSRFSVGFTNHLKNAMFLRIYNITLKEQLIYRCYYIFADRTKKTFDYKYSIRLANITNSLTKNPNGTMSCVLHGRNISSIKFIWEQRTLYGEHLRFIESVTKDNLGTLKRNSNLDMHQHWISCLNLDTNTFSKFDKEGEYKCIAQISIHGRSQAVNKTASIKIKNKPGQPYCVMDTTNQHGILGTNIIIAINFYSKPKYSALSFRKDDSEPRLGDIATVSLTNISMDVYNVTIFVSGYEIIINITEFSGEDVGNYTVSIMNEFGYCNCTVRLLLEDDIKINRYPSGNVINGQSVLFVCQSKSRRTTYNFSWTKNGITLSNSSSIVLENITQDDNGNYTCSMKNKQRYFTKNEVLMVNPLSCTTYDTEQNGLLFLKRFLGIAYFIVPIALLVVSVVCNIFVHLYCKNLKTGTLDTDENDISRERIEMVETDNEYHTINEDNFRIEDTEIENQSETTISIRESLYITGVQIPAIAYGGNELQMEEDDYLHPYCTVMKHTIEMHDYKSLAPGVIEHEGSAVALNREFGKLYENMNN